MRASPRTRLDPEERRAAILDTAATMVARDGVAPLTMEAIGREAGVSKSLVYAYFPSLQALLSTLLERELRRLRARQHHAAEAAATFEGLVRAVTHVYLEYIGERGLLIERLQAEPSVSVFHDPTEYGREAAVDYLAALAERHFGLPPEVARAATEISFGLPAQAGAYLLRGHAGLSRERLEELTVTMIEGVFVAVQSDHAVRRQALVRTGKPTGRRRSRSSGR